jgi:hypothetical protein
MVPNKYVMALVDILSFKPLVTPATNSLGFERGLRFYSGATKLRVGFRSPSLSVAFNQTSLPLLSKIKIKAIDNLSRNWKSLDLRAQWLLCQFYATSKYGAAGYSPRPSSYRPTASLLTHPGYAARIA